MVAQADVTPIAASDGAAEVLPLPGDHMTAPTFVGARTGFR